MPANGALPSVPPLRVTATCRALTGAVAVRRGGDDGRAEEGLGDQAGQVVGRDRRPAEGVGPLQGDRDGQPCARVGGLAASTDEIPVPVARGSKPNTPTVWDGPRVGQALGVRPTGNCTSTATFSG